MAAMPYAAYGTAVPVACRWRSGVVPGCERSHVSAHNPGGVMVPDEFRVARPLVPRGLNYLAVQRVSYLVVHRCR
jgi:hypothetical protein